MKAYLLAVALFLLAGVEAGARLNPTKSRGRRSTLSIPKSSGVKWTIDFIVPVTPLLNTTNTYVTWDFSLFTTVPTRTQVAELYDSLATLADERNTVIDHDFIEEQRNNHERRRSFDYLEGLFASFGLDGPTCMRRAICELSEAPLGNYGLLGKALHILLTPHLSEMPEEMAPLFSDKRASRDVNIAEDFDNLDFIGNAVHDEYTEAYHKGKEGKCATHYSDCSISIFKILNF